MRTDDRRSDRAADQGNGDRMLRKFLASLILVLALPGSAFAGLFSDWDTSDKILLGTYTTTWFMD